MSALSESVVENAALEWLSALGYSVRHGPDIAPDGPAPERVSHAQVLLTARLRDALPNASFIGFTGTPIEKEDVNTPAVFGQYIDVYDINRGVEDGATVPIYYESRLARIELDEDEKPNLDDQVAELTEDEVQGEQERLKRKWANIEAVVGAKKRLALVAGDLVEHFENRVVGMDSNWKQNRCAWQDSQENAQTSRLACCPRRRLRCS